MKKRDGKKPKPAAIRRIEKPLVPPRDRAPAAKAGTDKPATGGSSARFYCKCLVTGCACNRAVEAPWKVCHPCKAGEHTKAGKERTA